MDKTEFSKLTDEALLMEKKKMKNSRLLHALAIGFLAGILFVGVVSWIMSEKKNFGFLIPMAFPAIFIYRMLKAPNTNKDLEEVLKERGLNG